MSIDRCEKTEAREICFWTCDDGCEQLHCMDMHDAIEEALDNLAEPGVSGRQFLDSLPEKLEVYGYARCGLLANCKWLEESVLENLLKWLDEENGDPNEATEPTENMKYAASAFVSAVLDEYVVRTCERVCTETVDPREWVKENRPDWINDDSQ